MNKETIEQLGDYLSIIAVYLDNSKNCLEKINILSKMVQELENKGAKI